LPVLSVTFVQEKLRHHINQLVLLTDAEFAFVLSHFSLRTVKKHQYLIQEGEPARYAYYVVSGLLKLVYTDESGKAHIVSFAMEDWWESDFQAFYTQRDATMSLDCVEDTTVYCLTLENYRKLCADLPKMERFFLEKSTAGYISAQQRLLSLLASSASKRYDQFLALYPSLVQRVPKTLLAAYLGVSRETLSRLPS
jgi:CRP-like cAMP-binding protein